MEPSWAILDALTPRDRPRPGQWGGVRRGVNPSPKEKKGVGRGSALDHLRPKGLVGLPSAHPPPCLGGGSESSWTFGGVSWDASRGLLKDSFEASWESFGASWGLFWALFWASWGLLGASWGPLGASWRPLAAVLGPSWAVLRASWALLAPSWAVLGRSWGPLGAVLGSSWPSWSVGTTKMRDR